MDNEVFQLYEDKILNGKKLAFKMKTILKNEIKAIQRPDERISLCIFLFSEFKSSEFYVGQIVKTCEALNINTIVNKLDSTINQSDLVSEIKKVNENPKIHGIFISFPVPYHIDYFDIINEVEHIKDIDGLCNKNKELLKANNFSLETCMISPTALSALELIRLAICYNNNIEAFCKDCQEENHFLKESLLDLKEYEVSVIGKGVSAGKPTIDLMEKCGAKVRSFNSQSGDYRNKSNKSDIVISAIGRKANFISEDFIKEDSIVIDASIIPKIVDSKEILVGDVDFINVVGKVRYISPVPGGVGSLTVIMFLKNLLKSYIIHTKESKD